MTLMTAQAAIQAEKNTLFKLIRHEVASQFSCPVHLSINDLKVILSVLTKEKK